MILIRTQVLIAVIPLLLLFTSCANPAGLATRPSAATPAAITPIDPATVASISGVVHFEGTTLAARKIDMSADAGCKGENQSEVVEVNDGRLANVLVYVKDGLGGYKFAPPPEKVTIAQEGCRYVPHVAAVMVGQPVVFLDKDETLHNIHPVTKNNQEWNQSQMPNGGQLAHTFTAAEVMIPVKCNQHPWMNMYLSVMSNPFFAVTGKDGSFELKGLPPGTYTIAAVHEKYGEQEMKITVGPKDDKHDVRFDFRPVIGGLMTLPDAPIAEEGFLVTYFLTVADQARSKEFYVGVLGGKVVSDADPSYIKLANSWIILNGGGGPTPDKPEVLLETPRDLNRVSSFLNLRVADVWACYRQWKAKGAEFLTEPLDNPLDNHGHETRCYMRDPDGYLIEVAQYTQAAIDNFKRYLAATDKAAK